MPVPDTHLQQVQLLYSDHQGWLKSWLRRRLGCAEQAADVAHDTFLRVICASGTLSGLQEPRAYLTTTARRLLIDRARHQRIEEAYLSALSASASDTDMAPSPESIAAAIQIIKRLIDGLDNLPAKARQAFLLHYMEDRPQSEIASELGVSVRMIQKYLSRALLCCHEAFAA